MATEDRPHEQRSRVARCYVKALQTRTGGPGKTAHSRVCSDYDPLPRACTSLKPPYSVSMSELAERRADEGDLWSDWNEGALRRYTLGRNHTDYIVIDAGAGGAPAVVQAGHGRDGLMPVGPVILASFYQSVDSVVHRVVSGDAWSTESLGRLV